jgi:hypothetical protein
MALERKDRIKDQTTTTGTGTVNLDASAPTGFRTFAAAVTSGATVRYLIESSDQSEWEIGEGVFTDGTPDTLTRVKVISSSNSGSLVNFSAGTKTVSLVLTSQDVTDTAPQNLLKNGNFINNSTNGYGSTPDDWTSSNANPVQGGIPTLTKQELIDITGVADGDIEGLWPCNGFINTDDIEDLSSNGYDLDCAGHVPGTSSDGLMGTALDFEASSSQYASVSGANLNITGSQTFIAFIKPETVNANTVIMSIDKLSSRGRGLQVQTNGAASFYAIGLTTNSQIDSDVLMQAGKWYMLVGVYDSSNTKLKIWVNGIKKEVTASGSSNSSTANFAIGTRFTGGSDAASNFYDGLIQNAAVLSVALSDDQVKRLLAATMYKGQKIRRATTDGYLYQDLPMDLVERLRGKTVALRAEMYQEVASTGQISILQTLADGTTSESIISATDATTGSWLEKLATGTISATAVGIQIRLKHSTSDGNTWFKKVSLYEGSILLPYDHSKDDWSRFPRLLRMDIPAVISGYQFEELRNYTISSPIYSGFSVNQTAKIIWQFFGKLCRFHQGVSSPGTSNATTKYMNLPVLLSSSITGDTRLLTSKGRAQDNGGAYNPSLELYSASTNLTQVQIFPTVAAGSWTASGSAHFEFSGEYPID